MVHVIFFRPTSWELKETLEREQEDVDSYLDAAKFICGAEDAFDPTEEEVEEEAFEEQMIHDYMSKSMDDPSEVYEEAQWSDTDVSFEKEATTSSTKLKPKSNLPFSSKVTN